MSLWSSYRSTYTGLPRAAWLLAGAQLVNSSGTMVVFFLTLYLTTRMGFSLDQAGGAMSGYGLGMLAGTLAGGALCDRIGPNAVQRLSLSGSALLLILLSFMHQFPAILLVALLWGFSNAMLFPANAAAMAAVCPEPVRAKGFVLNRLANNLGATIGPVVGGVLARYDYRLLFWVDGSTCLLASLVLWRLFAATAPSRASPAPSAPRAPLLQDRLLFGLLASTLGLSLIIAQVFAAFGPYLRIAEDLAEPSIGLLLAVNTLLIVFLQMPLIHFVARFSRTRAAAAGGLFFAAGFGLMPLGHGMAFVALTVAVWTFGEMLAFPSLMTAVSLRAPAGSQGRYQGLHSLAFSLGFTLGPALGARLIAARGFSALWSAAACLGLFVAVLLVALPFSREAQIRPGT